MNEINPNLSENFTQFRTGDICLSAGENIGDIMIFIGRHSTIQHSCILVWLDKKALQDKKIKVHPYFIDDETTTLSFLGLAEGNKLDMGSDELQKGLILYHPEELFINAPIVYIRPISKNYISDEYMIKMMEEYISIHYLKLKYAYGKGHIVTVGLGFDVFGKHPTGVLCSENIYMFLHHICQYPEFIIEGKIYNYEDYKVPDAIDRMYVPDFFSAEYNTHPIFESEEVRVISTKNEEDITVKHPYFIMFVVLIIIILFLFFVINNYCESCNVKGYCPIGSKDFFDSL